MEKKTNGLGITCFVLGIVGFILAIIGVGAWLGTIGLILGLISLFLKNRKKGLAIAGVVLCSISCIIGYFMLEVFTSDDDEPKKVAESNIEDEDTPLSDGKEFKVGDVVEMSHTKITFLSFKDLKDYSMCSAPEKGKKYVIAEFEIENLSDSDYAVSSWDFTGYVDGYDTDEAYVEEDSLDATLSSGKKIKGAISFEVSKDMKEMTLEYKPDWFGNNKAVFRCK